MSNFIENLELSVRTTNCLVREGITTADQFMDIDPDVAMKEWHMFGKRCAWEVRQVQESIRQRENPYLIIAYTNYRGLHSLRKIVPKELIFGSAWHPGEWVLRALDMDIGELRDFCLKTMVVLESVDPTLVTWEAPT